MAVNSIRIKLTPIVSDTITAINNAITSLLATAKDIGFVIAPDQTSLILTAVTDSTDNFTFVQSVVAITNTDFNKNQSDFNNDILSPLDGIGNFRQYILTPFAYVIGVVATKFAESVGSNYNFVPLNVDYLTKVTGGAIPAMTSDNDVNDVAIDLTALITNLNLTKIDALDCTLIMGNNNSFTQGTTDSVTAYTVGVKRSESTFTTFYSNEFGQISIYRSTAGGDSGNPVSGSVELRMLIPVIDLPILYFRMERVNTKANFPVDSLQQTSYFFTINNYFQKS